MKDRHAITPYPIRMPPELRTQLEEAAKEGNRSLHAEIIARLQASFVSESEFHVGMKMTEQERTTMDRITEAIEKLDYVEALAKKLNDASVVTRLENAIKNADLVGRISQLLDDADGVEKPATPATPEKPQDPPKDAAKPADTAGKLNAAAKSWEGEKFAHLRKAPPARTPNNPAIDPGAGLPAAAQPPPPRTGVKTVTRHNPADPPPPRIPKK